MQHARNVGPILFACNENIAHVMPHVTAHAVMPYVHHVARAWRQASHPNYIAMPGITYGHAIHAGQKIFIKINCLTFYHPKYEICKPECAEKDSHCHAQRE